MPKEEVVIKVDGMSCGHCVKTVRGALEGLKAVEILDVQIGHAKVRFDPSEIAQVVIVAAIDETGFEASVPASA